MEEVAVKHGEPVGKKTTFVMVRNRTEDEVTLIYDGVKFVFAPKETARIPSFVADDSLGKFLPVGHQDAGRNNPREQTRVMNKWGVGVYQPTKQKNAATGEVITERRTWEEWEKEFMPLERVEEPKSDGNA